MDVHKNARSCPLSRELLFKRVSEQGWSVRAASEAAGMSDRRGRAWLRRAEEGEPFTDRSSRPSSGVATSISTRLRIVQLRRQWLTVRQIAKAVGVGASTAARICLPFLAQLFGQAQALALAVSSLLQLPSSSLRSFVQCANQSPG